MGEPHRVAPLRVAEPGEPGKSDAAETAALIYPEVVAKDDRQLAEFDRLTDRAHQLAAFGVGVVAIFAAILVRSDGWPIRIAFLVGFLAEAIGCVYAAKAWRISALRGAPDPQALWDSYRGANASVVRQQLIVSRLEAQTKNADIIAAKRRRVRRAYEWVVAGTAWFALVLVLDVLLR